MSARGRRGQAGVARDYRSRDDGRVVLLVPIRHRSNVHARFER